MTSSRTVPIIYRNGSIWRKCGSVAQQRTVPRLPRRSLLAACKDAEARHIVENVIDGTFVGDNDPWAHDSVLCTFAALRALLEPHAPAKNHLCAGCRMTWPCWTWHEAFAWVVLYDPIHGHLVDDWCHHAAGG